MKTVACAKQAVRPRVNSSSSSLTKALETQSMYTMTNKIQNTIQMISNSASKQTQSSSSSAIFAIDAISSTTTTNRDDDEDYDEHGDDDNFL